MAEQVGEVSPDGVPRLLQRAGWDVDGVVTTCTIMSCSAGVTWGVLIVDEIGLVAKGTRSAGVQWARVCYHHQWAQA